MATRSSSGRRHIVPNADGARSLVTDLTEIPDLPYGNPGVAAERRELDLRGMVRVILTRPWLVIVPVVLLTALQLGLALRETPMYSSSTELLLQPKSTDSLLSGVGNANSSYDDAMAARVLNTEIRVIESVAIERLATKALGYDASVSGGGDDTTDVMTVTATDTDAKRAAKTANVFAAEYVKFRRQQSVADLVGAAKELELKSNGYQKQIDALNKSLESPLNQVEPLVSALRAKRDGLVRQQQTYLTRIDALSVDASLKTGGAQVLTPAYAASTPFSPRPIRSALLGLFLGLVLGLGLAFLFEFLDDRIKEGQDLFAVAPGLPVLGVIPRISGAAWTRSRWRRLGRKPKGLPAAMTPGLATDEAYRALRTALQFVGLDNPVRSLLVTSSNPGEGKSTTVAKLARVMAQSGATVLVIDGDLRNPRLHEYFEHPREPGFTDVLVGRWGIDEVSLTVDDQPGLRVMSSGPIPPNPAELLGTTRALQIMKSALEHFDMVILDGPPVLPVTDPVVMAQLTDATLVVARSRKTTREDLVRTLETLRLANAPVAGLVLNDIVPRRRYGRYGYGYKYGYGYGYNYGYGDGSKRPGSGGGTPSRPTVSADLWTSAPAPAPVVAPAAAVAVVPAAAVSAPAPAVGPVLAVSAPVPAPAPAVVSPTVPDVEPAAAFPARVPDVEPAAAVSAPAPAVGRVAAVSAPAPAPHPEVVSEPVAVAAHAVAPAAAVSAPRPPSDQMPVSVMGPSPAPSGRERLDPRGNDAPHTSGVAAVIAARAYATSSRSSKTVLRWLRKR